MKLNRNYLTTEEIAEIVNVMMNAENSFEREIVKIGVVTQILVDDIETKETCDEYADLYFAQSDIDFARDINNYYLVDKIVENELSVENTVKDFLDTLNEKIDSWGENIKGLDQEKLLGQMKELVNNASLSI